MKKVYIILTIIIISATIWAQSPDKMSYQAIIRDSANELIINRKVGMQISILHGAASGKAVYAETHSATTNPNGLVSIEIGEGTIQNGDLSMIDWSAGPYFLQTETDPTGGTDYKITGTSQLLSVPYALYAKTAGSTTGTSARYIGELYGGGIIFWIDHTGQHGLIVSMVDLIKKQIWSDNTSEMGETNFWDGPGNTAAIYHLSGAAKLCADYVNADYGTGIYDDWYLPSVAELNHLWNNIYEVQKSLTNNSDASEIISPTIYWSSTARSHKVAWVFLFGNGNGFSDNKENEHAIRAIRTF